MHNNTESATDCQPDPVKVMLQSTAEIDVVTAMRKHESLFHPFLVHRPKWVFCLQAASGHRRDRLLRRYWSAWLAYISLCAKAVRHHRLSLMQAVFEALLSNAAAAGRQRYDLS